MLAKLMETQIWRLPVPTYTLSWRRAQQRNNGPLVPERAAPPSLTLKPDSSSSHVSGAFRAASLALELRDSESISEPMCGPFERDVWDSSCPPFQPNRIPADISPQFSVYKMVSYCGFNLYS